MNNTSVVFGNNSVENVTDLGIHTNEAFKKAHDIILIIILIVIMISMGADITWTQIWQHIRKPFGPAIGMFCQFILMPFVGFAYTKIFQFGSEIGTGVLIISCTPGGAVSNSFTYYLNGNISLSVTMTTLSTIFALGMMPLNVLIYGRSTESSNLVIPYGTIAQSLAMVTSPALVGMGIRWKFPKYSPYVTKYGSLMGFILIMVILIMECFYFSHGFYKISWTVILTTILMPATGFGIGFLLAWLCRRSIAVCKTIAIESGIQNVAVALSIIILSFDINKHTEILLVPWFYGIVQIGTFGIMCSLYQARQECVKKQNEAPVKVISITTKGDQEVTKK